MEPFLRFSISRLLERSMEANLSRLEGRSLGLLISLPRFEFTDSCLASSMDLFLLSSRSREGCLWK